MSLRPWSSFLISALSRRPSMPAAASQTALSSGGYAQQHMLQQVRTATKKAGGSTRNGRDSPGQRLGVKKFGGEVVIPGNIIIRQRGQKYHSGEQTRMGKDHTIYAAAPGYVRFVWNPAKKHQIVTVSSVNPNIPKKGVEPTDVVQQQQQNNSS